MANTERLLEVGRWAIAEQKKKDQGLPSEWDQAHWLAQGAAYHCDTACCIAGRVVLQDGGVPKWELGNYGVAGRLTARFTGFAELDGTEVHVENYAAETLGIQVDDNGIEDDGLTEFLEEEFGEDTLITHLFDPDNQLVHVLAIIRFYTGVDLTPEYQEV